MWFYLKLQSLVTLHICSRQWQLCGNPATPTRPAPEPGAHSRSAQRSLESWLSPSRTSWATPEETLISHKVCPVRRSVAEALASPRQVWCVSLEEL